MKKKCWHGDDNETSSGNIKKVEVPTSDVVLQLEQHLDDQKEAVLEQPILIKQSIKQLIDQDDPTAK